MLVDGIKLFEGSSISNASVETGATFPTAANAGELFFKTTDNLLYVYNGSAWDAAGSSGAVAASSLTGTTLASNVVTSSLTSVGTLGSLSVTGGVSAASFSGAGTGLTGTAAGLSIGGNAATASAVAASALTGTTLASGVTSSSLTSVGTLSSLTVGGSILQTSSVPTTYIRSTGAGDATLQLQNTVTGVGAAQGTFLGVYGTDGHAALYNYHNSDLVLGTNNKEQFRIVASGAWQVGGGSSQSAGTAGQVLTTNGSSTQPTWQNVGAGSLTGTTLASNVVASSLTSVGTLGSLTVTGNVTAADPTISAHLATKAYVDTAVNGLTWKTAVAAATTGNITLSGTQTIDGVAVVAGNRVLVKNQTTGSQNGIYVVAGGAWTRSTDMDGAPSVGEVNGAAVYVAAGTTLGNTAWTQSATITTVGTDTMTFVQFAATGAAAGNTLTGTSLASNIVSSSLTSVGTLSSLTVSGITSINGIGATYSATLTTAATTAGQVVDASLAIAAYRAVKYKVSVTSGSAYHFTEVTVIHDGTNVFMTEYGTVQTGASLATFTADISGGNLRLLTTPTNAVTTYKVVAVAIAV